MAGVFLAAPTRVDLPSIAAQWTSSEHWWTCGDDTWDLSSGDSGVFLMPGVRGLNMPPINRYTQKSASVAGSRWRGSVTEEREAFWPLFIHSDGGSQAWLDHNRRFWNTMRPDKTGVWTVKQPGSEDVAGESRSLTLRYSDDGSQTYDVAPELFGWMEYGITLVAEQPYWVGDVIGQVFGPPPGSVDFFGGSAHVGPPFNIRSASSMANASIENPGDVEAPPVWTLYGPFTTATVGVGARLITVPFTVADGEWVRIDTTPTDRRAMFGSGDVLPGKGVNRNRDLTSSSNLRGNVPPAASAQLSVNMAGTGRVEVEIQPRYYQAM